MSNATPGERASWPQLAINYGGHRWKWFLASLEKGSCVPLFTSLQWCQLVEFGQEVNKIRERLAQPWSLAELMWPPPLFKASGNPLPADNVPASFTAGTMIPTERKEGGGGRGSENICFSRWTHQIHDKTLSESKKIYYSQEQGNRWSASSSYDYSKLLVAIQTWRGRWLNAVSCMALVSLRLI